MLRALERGALHLIGVHRRERCVVGLPRADANHALDGLHEDLAVAHFARACRREDGLDTRLHERLGADHLDLDLFVEFHDDGGAAILPHDFLLAPVTRHAAQRDPGDAGPKQRRLDLPPPPGAYAMGDWVHYGITNPRLIWVQSIP